MTDTLEVRIAHLEGAYEQVDKRLGGVESALIQLRSDMNSSLSSSTTQLRAEINEFRTELAARLDSRMDGLTGRMDGLTGRMDSRIDDLPGEWTVNFTGSSGRFLPVGLPCCLPFSSGVESTLKLAHLLAGHSRA